MIIKVKRYWRWPKSPYSSRNNKTEEEKGCFEDIIHSIKYQVIHILREDQLPSQEEICGLRPMIDILVKFSDEYELQEDIQNKELISEEIEAIHKEFEAEMHKQIHT